MAEQAPEFDKLLAGDPYLKLHQDDLLYRWKKYQQMLQALEENEGGLDQFSRSYKHFGIVQRENGDVEVASLYLRLITPLVKHHPFICRCVSGCPMLAQWQLLVTLTTGMKTLTFAPRIHSRSSASPSQYSLMANLPFHMVQRSSLSSRLMMVRPCGECHHGPSMPHRINQ